MKDANSGAEVVVRSQNWDEILESIGPYVGFYRRTDDGALYAPKKRTASLNQILKSLQNILLCND